MQKKKQKDPICGESGARVGSQDGGLEQDHTYSYAGAQSSGVLDGTVSTATRPSEYKWD